METLRRTFKTFVYFSSYLISILSLLSIFRNSDFRYLKMLDFPRIQFFIISCILLILVLFLKIKWKKNKIIMVIGLVSSLVIQSFFLMPYTILAQKTVPDATELDNNEDSFTLMLSNVKMSNRNSDPLKKLIFTKDPDVILLMETDSWWDDQLNYLKEKYPFSHHTINDKAYGMVLYSKFKLENSVVKYLNNKNVPSLKTRLTLHSGKKIILHCVHPVPPTKFKDLPDNVGQKEKALIKVGKEINGEKLPVIVAGDLNDAVWARVDNLTQTKDLVNDIRVGRGFYSSFDATKSYMRWPLDHVFVSNQFKVQDLEKLHKIGSDHYPLFVKLRMK